MGGTQSNVTILQRVEIPTTVKSGKAVSATFEYTSVADGEEITIAGEPTDQFEVTPPSIPAPKDQHTITRDLTFTRKHGATAQRCDTTFTLGGSEKLKVVEVKP